MIILLIYKCCPENITIFNIYIGIPYFQYCRVIILIPISVSVIIYGPHSYQPDPVLHGLGLAFYFWIGFGLTFLTWYIDGSAPVGSMLTVPPNRTVTICCVNQTWYRPANLELGLTPFNFPVGVRIEIPNLIKKQVGFGLDAYMLRTVELSTLLQFFPFFYG